MKACKLEKRADGVIRWLERMKKSYSSGAVESAYMDAECARADLEVLRSDVFAGLTQGRRGMKFSAVFRVFRVIGLAAVIVMMAIAPLSRETVQVPEIVAVKPEAPAEIVQLPREIPQPPAPVTDTKPKKPRKVTSTKNTAKPSPPQPSAKPKADLGKRSVAYDKVYSLVQTGQRALKNDNSVIKVKGETLIK